MNTYKVQTAPAKAALRNSVNTTWKAKVQAYQNAVKAVVDEIKTPVATHMEIEDSTTLVTDA